MLSAEYCSRWYQVPVALPLTALVLGASRCYFLIFLLIFHCHLFKVWCELIITFIGASLNICIGFAIESDDGFVRCLTRG